MSVPNGISLLRRIRAMRVREAREDPDAFVELCGIDTSDPSAPSMEQHDVHLGMQRDITENRRVIFMTSPGIGKSTQLILRIVWEIGKNPNIRIVIASKNKNKEETGSGMFLAIRDYLENPLVREVFPHLARGPVWQDKLLTVKRSSIDPNPTLRVGATNHYMKGWRIDLLVLDDWYDERSCVSPTERNRLFAWFETVTSDRMTADARVVACCNAIHPDDPAHRVERLSMERPDKYRWVVRRIPVYDPPDYDIDLDDVEPTIPEFYPIERIRSIRDGVSQVTFQRMYLCNAVDETASVFAHQVVHRAFRPPDEVGGEGVAAYPALSLRDQNELGAQVVIGVDLAAKVHTKADRTVLTAVLYWPREDVRQVIWIESGRWRSDDVARKIMEWDRRFRPVHIMIETSGQQEIIMGAIRLAVQNERLRAGPWDPVPYPPVRSFTTTAANKWALATGVEAVAAELAAGRWRFPMLSLDEEPVIYPEVALLKNSMIGYIRGSHTGDHLMSLWLANQGIRMIAYDEDSLESRMDDEVERAIDRIAELARRYPVEIDPDDITDAATALTAWQQMLDSGAVLDDYEDDYFAVFDAAPEPERPDEYRLDE